MLDKREKAESPVPKPTSSPVPAPSLVQPGAGGPENGGAIILFCAADLLWATRIKETANSLGISARPVRTLDMLEARLHELRGRPGGSCRAGLIADLEHPEAVEFIRRAHLEGRGTGSMAIVAFGPHVATAALAAARDAGASTVMTRGAFAAQLPELLTHLARGGKPQI